jgi:hypothetical protein
MKKTFILLIVTLNTILCFGQNIVITGYVSSNHKNINLVNIDIAGLNSSAVTDDDGAFTLKLPNSITKGTIIWLRASKKGYETLNQQIVVSPELLVHINLKVKGHSKPNSKDKTTITILNKPAIENNQSIQVTSNNQSGGITANEVNIESPKRKLDDHLKSQLVDFLNNKNERIVIDALLGDSESNQFANEIKDYLTTLNYSKIDGVNQVVPVQPIVGQFIFRDSTAAFIRIGSKK